jgi:hypothetical protein
MKKIYESSNRAEAHLILHTLEEEGIKAALKGEFSSLEPVSVWLENDSDHDKASNILNDIRGTSSAKPKPTGKKDKSAWILFGIGIVFGICIGMLIMDMIQDKRERDARKQTTWDVNGDGRIDRWREYKADSITIDAIDDNADGKPDYWVHYKVNNYIIDEGDCDYDGRKDCWGKYSNNSIVERTWSFSNDTIIDKRVLYKNNRKAMEYIDVNRDGKFEYKVILDNFERIVKKESIK